MFTGLIKDIGTVKSIKEVPEGKLFVIETNLIQEINVDDSVSTNGVCLTATKIEKNSFCATAIHVTLEKSNLRELKVNSKVNLELAMKPNDRLGGHIVQGHVSGIGHIRNITKKGDNYDVTITTDPKLFRYFILEGSVAIDGTSLTIAKLGETDFVVSLIPHTYQNTLFHTKKIGDSVNIEVDMMAKYVERILQFDKKPSLIEKLSL